MEQGTKQQQPASLFRQSNIGLLLGATRVEAALQIALELTHNAIDSLTVCSAPRESLGLQIRLRKGQEEEVLLTIVDTGTGFTRPLEDAVQQFSSTKSAQQAEQQSKQQMGRWGLGLLACISYSSSAQGSGRPVQIVTSVGAGGQMALIGFDDALGQAVMLQQQTLGQGCCTRGTRIEVQLPSLSLNEVQNLAEALREFLERFSVTPEGGSFTTMLHVDASLLSAAEPLQLQMTQKETETEMMGVANGAGRKAFDEEEDEVSVQDRQYVQVLREGLGGLFEVDDKESGLIAESTQIDADGFGIRVSAVLFFVTSSSSKAHGSEYGGSLQLEVWRFFNAVPVLDTCNEERESCALYTAVKDFDFSPFGHKCKAERGAAAVAAPTLVRPTDLFLSSVRKGPLTSLAAVPVKLLLLVSFSGSNPQFSNLRKTSLQASPALTNAVQQCLAVAMGRVQSAAADVGTGAIFLSKKEEKIANVRQRNVPRVAMDLCRMAQIVPGPLQAKFCELMEINCSQDLSECAKSVEAKILKALKAASRKAPDDSEEEEEDEGGEDEDDGDGEDEGEGDAADERRVEAKEADDDFDF